ncbi:hypothetical protein ACQ4PT_010562 [Festuca glaucescens]
MAAETPLMTVEDPPMTVEAQVIDDLYLMEDTMSSLSSDTLQSTITEDDAASSYMVCVLHFDGASKGNPGKAGAGAVLMTEDRRVISRLREGLGIATNNVAEYGGLILGLKYAIRHGFKRIKVYGDSLLVCYQEWNADADREAEIAATTLAAGIVSEKL